MRKVLITMVNDHPAYREMLEVSAPTHAKYAARHGYDYFLSSPETTAMAAEGRPASWGKLRLVDKWVHEFKLFLDADVCVVDYSKDILEDHPAGKKFGMVVHHTSDGAVPNCGVLACMGTASQEIGLIWEMDQFSRSQWWWEQAGMICLLGGDPDATPVRVPEGPLWGELPYEWNPHVFDARGIPDGMRFFHATQCPDRAGTMRSVRGAP